MEFDTLEKFTRALKRLDQESLRAMLERRHAKYHDKLAHWNFLEATYEGGRKWFLENIFKYLKEGDREYQDRVKRAYRFNHTREVVDLVNKYIFKGQVARREADASRDVKKFWKHATLRRGGIEEFMKLASLKSSIFGKVWIVTDSNNTGDAKTIAEARQLGNRIYAYIVKPQNFLDAGFDDTGDLHWCIIRETWRDDENPITAGPLQTRYRLWTRRYWALFTEATDRDGKTVYTFATSGKHDLGRVPVVPLDNVTSEDNLVSPALIEDTAYLDRACANYCSNLDAIIQDQTFSQLVMPAQSMLPGEDGRDKMLEMGTKRIFTFDAQSAIGPEYISPDPKQANVILQAINKIISEIYHTVGMAGERTKDDNAVGIDNSSGVAKAYDFERMNAMLASKAASLAQAENELVELITLWSGQKIDEEATPLVTYPTNFDVRSIYDEFDIATKMALIQAPKTVRREQMKTLIGKMFPRHGQADIAKMEADTEANWPVDLMIAGPAAPPERVPTKENRQGQQTGDGA
jgi:hypothetical protein